MSKPLLAIIQARMGSSRLPGKSLMPICGKPLIFHVIERLQQSRRITEIVVATTDKEADTRLADAVASKGIRVVRGSEPNVLSRFALATHDYTGKYLVRVTGDAPFVDPVAIDRMYDTLSEANVDFFSEEPGEKPIHEGFEVFSYAALQRLLTKVPTHPVAMEHVTGYFKQNPSFVSHAVFHVPDSERFDGARMSVDTPADIEFVETVYARLGCTAPNAKIPDIVLLLRKDPALLLINSHVHQKSMAETARKVSFICECGTSVGYGHLSRVNALASVMRDKYATANTIYIVAADGEVPQAIDIEFPVKHIQAPQRAFDAISDDTDIVIVDVLNAISAADILELKGRGIYTVVIDDGSERRNSCNMAFYPACPDFEKDFFNNATASVYHGYEYAIINPVYASPPKRQVFNTRRILISMGGSDPAGYAEKVLKTLSHLTLKAPFTCTMVTGPGFKNSGALMSLAQNLNIPVEFVQSPANLKNLMETADFAVIAFGVTAYEAAAMMLPAVYMCLDHDHAAHAQQFVDAGLGVIGAKTPDVVDETKLLTALMAADNMCLSSATNETIASISNQIRMGAANVADRIING
ncbi:MAG: NTP transferase domain-containing protein [Deltaproteobacteria bacterium]|nr:NTP transferase domain-containing protein [Deltaproteobacteria bacterium]